MILNHRCWMLDEVKLFGLVKIFKAGAFDDYTYISLITSPDFIKLASRVDLIYDTHVLDRLECRI